MTIEEELSGRAAFAMLITVSYTTDPHQFGSAASSHMALERLINAGYVICRRKLDSLRHEDEYLLTEKGAAAVEAIMAVRAPVQKWVIE